MRSHNRRIWSPVCNARKLIHYSYLLVMALLCFECNWHAIVQIPCEYWYVNGKCSIYCCAAAACCGCTLWMYAGVMLGISWKPPACMQSAPMTEWNTNTRDELFSAVVFMCCLCIDWAQSLCRLCVCVFSVVVVWCWRQLFGSCSHIKSNRV